MGVPRYRHSAVSSSKVATSLTNSFIRENSKTYYPNGQYSTLNTTTGFNVAETKTNTMHDVVTKNYTKRSKSGEIINNPLLRISKVKQSGLCTVDYEEIIYRWMAANPPGLDFQPYPYQKNRIYGTMPIGNLLNNVPYLESTNTINVQKLQDLAVTDAWANINSSDILIGAAIAESSKTTHDLLVLARKVIKIVRAIKHPRIPKRLNKKSIKAASVEAEELYMSARYNLRPLYYDILGALKLTVEKQKLDRHTTRGYACDEVVESKTSTFSVTQFPQVVFRLNASYSYKVEARAGVLSYITDNSLGRRLGVALITETAWELTPFSFILDWFANIGAILSSWAPRPGVKKLTSWVTINSSLEQTLEVSVDSVIETPLKPSYPGAIAKTSVNCILGGSTVLKNSTFTTQRITNPPRPIAPSLNLNLDLLKSLDLAIIGKNLLSSSKR